jgi:enoyl-CoA hydratase/carnithine racemase
MIRTESHPSGVLCLMLDRSAKRNALTPPMLNQLVEAVRGPGAHARAIVLAGSGECFCAGFDLSLCREDDAALEALLSGLSHAVRTLRRAAPPVVVAAHGAAVAGGCALLGGADIVVTDEAATLGYPVVRLGISPAVSAPALRLLTGDAFARERLLDSALITGREAVRIGLAHEVTLRPADVLPRALAIAQHLAAKPRGGIQATKRWLNQLDGSTADAAFDRALGASLALVGSQEQQQRLERRSSR